MKGVSNIYFLVFLLFLFACKNTNKTNPSEETAHHDVHDDHPHAHDFACPMHPEMDGHEGEKCPKCGMNLEPKKTTAEKNSIRLQFNSIPSLITAQEEVQLFFTPENLKNKNQLVQLAVFIQNRNLAWSKKKVIK